MCVRFMMLRILGIFAINYHIGFKIAGLNEKSVLYFQVFVVDRDRKSVV